MDNNTTSSGSMDHRHQSWSLKVAWTMDTNMTPGGSMDLRCQHGLRGSLILLNSLYKYFTGELMIICTKYHHAMDYGEEGEVYLSKSASGTALGI